MAVQYAVIEGSGHWLIGWDWQFDDDTYGAEVSRSYSIWIVPGTTDPMED